MKWNDINCHQCTVKCNQKGAKSVRKGSPHCKSERGMFTAKKQADHTSLLKKVKGWFGR
jgi:hypothetical protein